MGWVPWQWRFLEYQAGLREEMGHSRELTFAPWHVGEVNKLVTQISSQVPE